MEKKTAKKQTQESPEEARRRSLLQETLALVYQDKRRANAACEALLNALGCMDGVFAASETALAEIRGVGPEGARAVRLVVEAAQLYLEERSWNLRRVFDTASAVEMFRPKFLGQKAELVVLMLLDGRGRMIFNDVVCRGTFEEVPLHMRDVLRLCIEYQSQDVFLAHNHPSGVALPSGSDLLVTTRLISALEGIGAYLNDHIIFAGDSYFSFSGSGLLRQQEDQLRQIQIDTIEAVNRMEQRLRGER